jgi:uncharacterized protein (DUF1697 family)
MNTYIALFRGINVGGRNKLRMADLKAVLETLPLQEIQTYIQSGNVVFQTEEADRRGLAIRITEAIQAEFGFSPELLILSKEEFSAALRNNPFPEAEAEPKTLHLYFLANQPQNPDFNTLNRLRADSEGYRLIDKTFYLHAPDGIGRSKLAAQVEKSLGVNATARNWRTASKIAEIAKV